MISLQVDGCSVDIVPVVNGLVSEAERVLSEFSEHEAYAASLGIEGVQTIKNRANIDDMFDVSELDLVYARILQDYGEVEFPSPAMCAFIDKVKELGKNVIPLDMNDDDFTTLYCDTISAFEFTNEHRLAKKGLKNRFSASTPEEFALEWDAFVNGKSKGQARICRKREEYMAAQIKDIARFRKSLLAIVEIERAEGLARLLERSHGMRGVRITEGLRPPLLRELRRGALVPQVRGVPLQRRRVLRGVREAPRVGAATPGEERP